VNGSGVTNLIANGQPVSSGRVALGDWGQLTVGSQAVDTSAPDGAKGYRTFVTEIDIYLTADHGGLPANSEIQIGYADAAAQTAPPAATTTPAPERPVPAEARAVTASAVISPLKMEIAVTTLSARAAAFVFTSVTALAVEEDAVRIEPSEG